MAELLCMETFYACVYVHVGKYVVAGLLKNVWTVLKPWGLIQLTLKLSEQENSDSMPLGWPLSRLCGPSPVL